MADVEALDDDDTGIRSDRGCELTVSDVHGEHRLRAALAKHLGEPAGRRAHVERHTTRGVDGERIQPGDQLVRGATDVVIGSRDDEVGIRVHWGGGLHDHVRRPTRDRRRSASRHGCANEPGPARRGPRRVADSWTVRGRPRVELARKTLGQRLVRRRPRASGWSSITSSADRSSARASSDAGEVHGFRIRRGPAARRAQGRWNGSAYSRSGTRKP